MLSCHTSRQLKRLSDWFKSDILVSTQVSTDGYHCMMAVYSFALCFGSLSSRYQLGIISSCENLEDDGLTMAILFPFNNVCPSSVSSIPDGVTALYAIHQLRDTSQPRRSENGVRREAGVTPASREDMATHYSFTSFNTISAKTVSSRSVTASYSRRRQR